LAQVVLPLDHDQRIGGIYVPVAMGVPYGEAIGGDAFSDDDEVVVGGVEPAGLDVGTAGGKGVIQVGAVGGYRGP
jgi:hypothetical protein